MRWADGYQTKMAKATKKPTIILGTTPVSEPEYFLAHSAAPSPALEARVKKNNSQIEGKLLLLDQNAECLT